MFPRFIIGWSCLLFGAIFSGIVTECSTDKKVHAEIISHGFGNYVAEPTTGKVTFQWKENK